MRCVARKLGALQASSHAYVDHMWSLVQVLLDHCWTSLCCSYEVVVSSVHTGTHSCNHFSHLANIPTFTSADEPVCPLHCHTPMHPIRRDGTTCAQDEPNYRYEPKQVSHTISNIQAFGDGELAIFGHRTKQLCAMDSGTTATTCCTTGQELIMVRLHPAGLRGPGPGAQEPNIAYGLAELSVSRDSPPATVSRSSRVA